jgi:hypothetical protein
MPLSGGDSVTGMANLDLRTVLNLDSPTITLLNGTTVTAKPAISGKLALSIREMGVSTETIETILRGLFTADSAAVLIGLWESDDLSISELNEMIRFVIAEVTGRPTTEPSGS